MFEKLTQSQNSPDCDVEIIVWNKQTQIYQLRFLFMLARNRLNERTVHADLRWSIFIATFIADQH